MLYGYLIENFKPYEPIFTADIDKYLDGSSENILDKLEKLIKDEKITKELIDTYISLYPMKVYKNLYETGVVYAITQG